GGFQGGADRPVFSVGRSVERQDFDLIEQFFNRLQQTSRATLRAAVSQFGSHNDACADVALADFANTRRRLSLRMPDQIGNDVRIQQITRQRTFSGRGTGSTISGKSSSTGFIVLRRATRPRLRTGSITRRSPSRCMIASLPGSSNSTGIRI